MEADPEQILNNYKVYTFVGSGEIAVLPTCWVKNEQVKYDSKKANEYIKSKKQPYKKWKTYNVRPVCDKLFDNYETAFKAEKILADKSELDSTDMEMIQDDNNGILSRKRKRKVVVSEDFVYENRKSSGPTSADDNDSSSDCSSGQEISDPPENCTVPPENNTVLPANSDAEGNDDFIADKDQAGIDLQHQILVENLDENCATALATSNDIATLKMAVEVHNQKLDELINLIKTKGRGCTHHGKENNDDGLSFEVPGVLQLPLRSIEEITALESELKQDEICIKFTSFLNRGGGETLRATVKIIVQKLYSLQVQQRINYTGREKKFKIGGLRQTRIILEIMQRNSGETEAKAIDELMYHLQHVSDRIRSAKKAGNAQ